MAYPALDSYGCASSGVIRGGRYGNQFDSVRIASEVSYEVPYTTPGQVLVLWVHGSGGQNTTNGRQFVADVSGKLAFDVHNTFKFHTIRNARTDVTLLRPQDLYGIRESQWMGMQIDPEPTVKMITARRLEALINWAKVNVPNINPAKWVLTGGSMGGWGTLSFGIRRANVFPALYPDRPRWRYSYTIGKFAISHYATGWAEHLVSGSPLLAPEDGGTSAAEYHDITSYAANTANKIPWIGWNVGRNDGYVNFSDHIDAVVALRAAKRGFAFAWNDGNHTTGSIQSEILQSYPWGCFELGKGYPLFTSHSGDQDPAVDLVGGINIGLSFRNVVESSSLWSCEITSVIGARTVDVEPISDVFKTPVTKQTITIPAANSWVSVSFSG